MEGLNLDNILGTDEIDNLFVENLQETPPEQNGDPPKDKEENNKEDNTAEVDVENLFAEPESVGSEENNKEVEEGTTPNKEGTSPNNFYSSIAKALKEEGIFPDLDDESYNKVTSAEAFRDLVEQQINNGLDEKQKRVSEALEVGIEPSEIKKYENTINFLDNIKEENITDESDKGEKLRKDLIFQDFINRGYSQERANREVKKSFDAGTDIDDAKEALKSNVEFFNEGYENLIEGAKEAANKEKKEREEEAAKLKTSILEDSKVFGDLNLDKTTRQKVYDAISKPIYKDPNTGKFYTAIQKYELDNKTDFLKNLGLFFTLTDGFKNLDKLVKGKVNKEVKKGLKELEHTLNNTARTSDGNLKFVSGVDDSESYIGKGWKLDI